MLTFAVHKYLFVNDGHMAYAEQGRIGGGVRVAVGRVRLEFLGDRSGVVMGRQAAMDTVILIDSTDSMRRLIDRYKREALRLASLTLNTGGRIALFEYRDLKDPYELRMLCDFGCSLEEFSTER